MYFMCVGVLFVCLSVYNMCAWFLQWPEDVGSPRTGVTRWLEAIMWEQTWVPCQAASALNYRTISLLPNFPSHL